MPGSAAIGRTLSTRLLILFAVVLTWCAGSASAADRQAQPLDWKLAYDGSGRVERITDPAGQEARFQYTFQDSNRLRKLVRSLTSGATTTWNFEQNGRLQRMEDGAGTVSYGYDPWNRVSRVERQGSPAITYGYDTRNRVTRLQVGDVYQVGYTYDFLGRLDSIKTPFGDIRYEYLTGQGQVLRTLPNGVRTVWQYDPRGRLTQLFHVDSHDIIIAEYTYQRRPDGLITSIAERSRSGDTVSSFEYDQVGRLVSAKGPRSFQYEYDAVGNRLKSNSSEAPPQAYAYDWLGRLASVNGEPAEYDTAGRLTSARMDGLGVRYRYDLDSHLVDAQSGAVTYRYDGDGKLLARKADGIETTFIADPMSTIWRPLVVQENGRPQTLVVWDSDTPLILVRGGKPEFLLHDHLGSVRAATDSQGQVLRNYTYDPFGVPQDTITAADFAPRYAGLFWDPRAQVYLTAARAYAPRLGAFLQIEPRGEVPENTQAAVMLYGYSGGDPVNFRDINGLERQTEPDPVTVPKLGNYVLDQLRLDEQYFRQQLSQSQQSSDDIAQEVRSLAVGKFLSDHVGYPGYQGPKFGAIANSIIPTDYGPVNLDWAAALGFAEIKSGLPTMELYYLGKPVWFILRAIAQVKGPPDPFNLFPAADTNSTKWLDALYNAHIPLEQVILPASARTTAPSPPAPRAAPASNPPGGIAGASFQVSSTPLGGADLRAYNLSKQLLQNAFSGAPGGWQGHTFSSDNGRAASSSPSNVGGVYLGGAGQSLAGLDNLNGIVRKPDGNLVLVSKSGDQLTLPPLRLDDLVTVFRSVYMNGEGPTVTIDPNPQNPEASAMIIKHSEATEGTYVGWILYQADRLMKGYTLGTDNITAKPIVSAVAEFPGVLDEIYFGGGDPTKLRKEGIWERFWIVPAEARRFTAPRGNLSLFDVPLKVRTQKMRWQNGKLVDDTTGKSSSGALAFTKWFTANYDLIARERLLQPPAETGITEPVPVFAELRRIALMTSIAERLRDQGVPMPFWMRDYEVRVVPFEKTTPALEVTRSNQKVSARIFGGVGLSAADSVVKTFSQNADLSKLDKPRADEVRQYLTLATNLEQSVLAEGVSAEPLKTQNLTERGNGYQAVSLPGADTKALSPAQIEQVDLVVPVEGSDPIRLVRSYNSFFNPTGPWGKGWAFDLPRLVPLQVPVHRDDNAATYQRAYELITPLNSRYARFSKVEAVPELAGSRLQVPDQPGLFFGLADAKAEFLSAPTHQLLWKDGTVSHFSDAGDLVATEHAGSRVVYERDNKGRLTRIVGMLGYRPAGSIDLRYDASDRIETARTTGTKGDVVIRYQYDQSGRLSGMMSDAGQLGYHYANGLLTEIGFRSADAGTKATEEKLLRRLQYGSRGQLQAETDADGNRTDYRSGSDASGSTMTIAYAGSDAGSDFVRYDRLFRPTEAKTADGTRATWVYSDRDGVTADIVAADGQQTRVTETADQRTRSVALGGSRTVTAQYDGAGRVTTIDDTGQPILRRELSPAGRVLRTQTETTASNLEYGREGRVSRVIESPPNESGKFQHWQATKLDLNGSPREVTDYRGLQVIFDYTPDGLTRSVVTKRDGKNFGFQVDRDSAGRVREIRPSWGTQRHSYDATGHLAKLETEEAGQTSSAEWQSGLLRKIRQPDGGEYVVTYHEQGKAQGLEKAVIAPNRLALEYDYNDAGQPSQVRVGTAYVQSRRYDPQGRLTGWSYTAPRM